jgi:gas vesicle protein
VGAEMSAVVALDGLLQSALAVARSRANKHRVDGLIIGTGEADFTKGNTVYTLNYQGKAFQLIDVPGIEGDEQKYASMVREAVAKAHLVFYVNGTNKKPESATAKKIGSYLRRGTQVCPIVNLRGKADTYAFEEDRVSLENHGGDRPALKQTIDVLESVLGKDVLLPGLCVQGLLAFCAVAGNAETQQTSIHPQRAGDLGKDQSNYLKHFKSAAAMFKFSQLIAVAQVIHVKLKTFKEDIVESNKTKVRELLSENLGALQTTLNEHRGLMERITPEIEKCRVSIDEAVKSFERLSTTGRKNLWSQLFNELAEQADDIVATHYGDNEIISANIKRAFDAQQATLVKRLNAQIEEHLEGLRSSLSQAMTRLREDAQRVEFQQRIAMGASASNPVYGAFKLDMGLGFKGWGSIALSVGSSALAGTPWGPVGIAIGAVLGILASVIGLFTGKEKRIRKAQAAVQEKISDMRDQVMRQLPGETAGLLATVHSNVKASTLSQIDALESSLKRPLAIIDQQMMLMVNITTQLEKMPHGTLQPIQC